MRTEDDIRAAFDQLANEAADTDTVLAALPGKDQPVRRSRTPLVIGAVLATTAAAIAVPLTISHDKTQISHDKTQAEVPVQGPSQLPGNDALPTSTTACRAP